MEQTKTSNIIRWITSITCVILHPILLYILFPLVGEKSNLVIILAPIVTSLLLNWKIGIAVTLLNTIVTAVMFSALGNSAGPEGLPKGIIAFLIGAVICAIIGFFKYQGQKNDELRKKINELHQ